MTNTNSNKDIHQVLIEQADAVEKALLTSIENDSESAGHDKIVVVIEGQQYELGLWSVDVLNSFESFINEVKQFAKSQL